MSWQRFIKFLVAVAVLLAVCPVTVFAQRDRVGPEPRAVRTGRETTHPPDPKTLRDPAASAHEQTARYGNTTKMDIRTAVAGIGREEYEKAFAEAKRDYVDFLAQFTPGAPFAQTHVKLRFEDFAPAYFLVFNSEIRGKYRSGRALAERRAQLVSYEKILNREVGLNSDTAKSSVKEAKAIVASFKMT